MFNVGLLCDSKDRPSSQNTLSGHIIALRSKGLAESGEELVFTFSFCLADET
jgi:hypothetical protein